MPIVLAVIGWMIVGLIGVVLCLIVVPIHLRLTARSDPGREIELQLRLLTGGTPALLCLSSLDGADGSSVPTDQASAARKPRGKRRRRLPDRLQRRLPRLLGAAPGLIVDTFRGIHLDRLRAEGRFGLGDPAQTGRLYGQLCPLIYSLPGDRISLAVTPDFDRAGLSGQVLADLHVQIIRLAWPTLRLLWRELVLAR